MYDVAIIGAGVAGAAAAYRLRGLKTLTVEAESFVGGRTRSEPFGDGLWANYGAGYFSADKRIIIGLGDEVGVPFIRFDDSALAGDFLPDGFSREDIAEIRAVKRRILAEQQNRRDPADPGLDAMTFAEWLGPVRPNVRAYWEMWCSTMSGPMDEVSLYGVLLMSGANRTEAFADATVDYDKRGNLVVEGGNGLIAQRLIAASETELVTAAKVTRIVANEEEYTGYTIVADGPDGPSAWHARTVICALPAPVAAAVVSGLPDWKLRALETIRYGRIMGMPVVVGPRDGDYPRFVPAADYRADAVYCETDFLLRSPTDLDAIGAYFVCQVYDRAAAVIWSDDDASIRAGVYAAFADKFPELADRVQAIGVHRWQWGLPQYTPGRMAATPDLVKPVGGISFCGDYSDVTHTDGAARSGLRAAAEARSYLQLLRSICD